MYETPILFIIFNRPNETTRVFEEIRKQKPAKLFIAADGPRPNKKDEDTLCKDARNVATLIDWPCDVHTLFHNSNLGCKKGVTTAINWFFEHVDEGIILEDDCLPDQSFWDFSHELLRKYRHDDTIMHINGTTFLLPTETSTTTNSYYFSRCVHVWGWATWKRAWKKYDGEMNNIESLEKISGLFTKKEYLQHWLQLFTHVKKNKVDTWDAAWQYSLLFSDGFAITPKTNLITNIGFGDNATHTKKKDQFVLPTTPLVPPFYYDGLPKIDTEADNNLMIKLTRKTTLRKIISLIKSL